MSEIIEVKKIKADAWSGFKFYKGSSMTMSAVLSGKGTYKTGLTKEEQFALEEELTLEKNTLSPNSAYWQSYFIRIPEDGLKLNMELASDRLAYSVLKADTNKVATSQEDLRTKSKAIVIMTNRVEEAKAVNIKNKDKKEAWKTFSVMSSEDMKTFLLLVGTKANSTSPEVIESLVSEYVEKSPSLFLEIWKDDRKEMKLFLLELAEKNIIIRNKSAFYNGDELLGYNMEDAIKFLKEPKHSELLVSLKERLREAKGEVKQKKIKE